MRWHEHESYLCSDSPPVSSGSLLDFQRHRSRGHDPGVLLVPRLLPLSEKKWYLKVDFWLLCSSLRHGMLLLQRKEAIRTELFLEDFTKTFYDFGTKKGYQHMNTNTSVNNPSTVPAQEPYITGSVTSQDGTTIGYRQLGHGPGVVLLHGAMESAQSHMQLAEALADTFTIYLPDRRGRGLSGPYGKDYSIQKDVEDMDALLTKTGAHYVFGVSSGGLIWLQAALTLPAIHKAALYEPMLLINGSVPTTFVTRYDKEMAQGKGALESFRAIRAEVLLLGGSTSPAFLKVALDALEKVFPHAKRIEFPGLGHGGSGNTNSNTNRGGQPERVAQELRRFFAEPYNS